VLVSMTFRTPTEAVALANNTRYGLAASLWSDNLNLSLDVARKIKAGTVWINSTNLFDAAAGFGGTVRVATDARVVKRGCTNICASPGRVRRWLRLPNQRTPPMVSRVRQLLVLRMARPNCQLYRRLTARRNFLSW